MAFVSTFVAGAGSVDDPDTYAVKQKSAAAIPTHTNMILGKKGGKNTADHAVFVRFEVGIPKDATITGLRIIFKASGQYDTDGDSTMN